ncbi:MAG: 2-dehydropantoate 2-reductase [Myxococcota bacterium]
MRIGIVGPGAIGGYLALQTSQEASVVVLDKVRDEPRPPPEGAVDVRGRQITAGELTMTSAPEDLATCDLVAVATKSGATAAVARTLAGVVGPDTPVVSMQNGLRNVTRLQAELGARAVGGVVGFNVFRDGPRRLTQATEGALYVGRPPSSMRAAVEAWVGALRRAGETVLLEANVEEVRAGKLLLNLNNGVCAATGMGIVASIEDGDARWCFATAMREGLRVMKAAGVTPGRATVLPPQWLPLVLRLPDVVIRHFGGSLVSMSRDARSSTLQDLDRGATTEIDEINGAIVWLAERAGVPCPVNRRITEVVHDHERAEGTPAFLSPQALRGELERAITRAA